MGGVGLGAGRGVEVGRVVGVEPVDHEVQRGVVVVGGQSGQVRAELVAERGLDPFADVAASTSSSIARICCSATERTGAGCFGCCLDWLLS